MRVYLYLPETERSVFPSPAVVQVEQPLFCRPQSVVALPDMLAYK